VSKLEERNRLPNEKAFLIKKREEQIVPLFHKSENK
jgi:hypothetical protein